MKEQEKLLKEIKRLKVEVTMLSEFCVPNDKKVEYVKLLNEKLSASGLSPLNIGHGKNDSQSLVEFGS